MKSGIFAVMFETLTTGWKVGGLEDDVRQSSINLSWL